MNKEWGKTKQNWQRKSQNCVAMQSTKRNKMQTKCWSNLIRNKHKNKTQYCECCGPNRLHTCTYTGVCVCAKSSLKRNNNNNQLGPQHLILFVYSLHRACIISLQRAIAKAGLMPKAEKEGESGTWKLSSALPLALFLATLLMQFSPEFKVKLEFRLTSLAPHSLFLSPSTDTKRKYGQFSYLISFFVISLIFYASFMGQIATPIANFGNSFEHKVGARCRHLLRGRPVP